MDAFRGPPMGVLISFKGVRYVLSRPWGHQTCPPVDLRRAPGELPGKSNTIRLPREALAGLPDGSRTPPEDLRRPPRGFKGGHRWKKE